MNQWSAFDFPKVIVLDICEFIHSSWSDVCAQAAALIKDVCKDASVPGFLKWVAQHLHNLYPTWENDFFAMVFTSEYQSCISRNEMKDIIHAWACPQVMIHLSCKTGKTKEKTVINWNILH